MALFPDLAGIFAETTNTLPTAKIATALLLLLSVVAGCRSETPFGRCIGLNQSPDSTLRYEYSARNIALGIVFSGVVAPPIIVALNELRCPVGRQAVRP